MSAAGTFEVGRDLELDEILFVDSGWDKVLDDALKADNSALRIVCPFVKKAAAERLLRHGRPRSIQVITRANLDDFYGGVSDTAALRLLMENGGEVRGVKNLHAKLYLFGNSQAVVTSANLTEAALLRNHEFGLVAQEQRTMRDCRRYFDKFWKLAGERYFITKARPLGEEGQCPSCCARKWRVTGGARRRRSVCGELYGTVERALCCD